MSTSIYGTQWEWASVSSSVNNYTITEIHEAEPFTQLNKSDEKNANAYRVCAYTLLVMNLQSSMYLAQFMSY